MKQVVAVCTVLLLLTGCGVAQQMQLNSAADRAKSEIARQCIYYQYLSKPEAEAWNKAYDMGNATCSSGDTGPVPRDKMVAMIQCYSDIYMQTIRPVAYSKSAFDRLKSKATKAADEYAAGDITWEDYQTQVADNKSQYLKRGKKGSYFNVASCQNAIVNREIMPVYTYKYLLTQYMADSLAFARKADKQKMDAEDFQVGMQKLWADFTSKENGAMAQAQAQQAAAWQRTFENLQQLESQQRASDMQCGSVSIAPIATAGCKNVCINGRWAEVC
ncbi:hypothetical protein GC197_03405 [bacterium]|nr:hypothetical protein [bacterium]